MHCLTFLCPSSQSFQSPPKDWAQKNHQICQCAKKLGKNAKIAKSKDDQNFFIPTFCQKSTRKNVQNPVKYTNKFFILLFLVLSTLLRTSTFGTKNPGSKPVRDKNANTNQNKNKNISPSPELHCWALFLPPSSQSTMQLSNWTVISHLCDLSPGTREILDWYKYGGDMLRRAAFRSLWTKTA